MVVILKKDLNLTTDREGMKDRGEHMRKAWAHEEVHIVLWEQRASSFKKVGIRKKMLGQVLCFQ